MRNHLPNRASVTLVVAAAFIAFGGISVAATRYVITSKKQIAPSVLRQLSRPGPRGKAGLAGNPGIAGAAGTPGTFNASNVTVVNGPTAAFKYLASGKSTASCPTGTSVISGGFQSVNGPNDGGMVSDDGPSGANGWTVQIVVLLAPVGFGTGNAVGASGQFYAQAVCAS
jgi:hypothetical protein